MAKQLQLRRGTTAQHATFTGAVGEVTIDTDKDVVVVHDGATAGGFPSQKELVSGTNIKTVNSTSLLGSGDVVVQESLVSGTNIKTINSTSLLGSGNIDVIQTVTNIDELKDFVAPYNNYALNVLGYSEAGDGGGGIFYWDASKPKSEHNGGTVIDPAKVFPTDWNNQTQLTTWFTAGSSGTGCWVRQYDGSVNVKWFGAKGDGVSDDYLPIQNILDLIFKEIYLPEGVFNVSGTLITSCADNIGLYQTTIKGAGKSITTILKTTTSIGHGTVNAAIQGATVGDIDNCCNLYISNLTLNGGDYGLYAKDKFAGCRVEDCYIRGTVAGITVNIAWQNIFQRLDLRGAKGFEIRNTGTSNLLSSCYCYGTTVAGFVLRGGYSSGDNLAVDASTGVGYILDYGNWKLSGVGCESPDITNVVVCSSGSLSIEALDVFPRNPSNTGTVFAVSTSADLEIKSVRIKSSVTGDSQAMAGKLFSISENSRFRLIGNIKIKDTYLDQGNIPVNSSVEITGDENIGVASSFAVRSGGQLILGSDSSSIFSRYLDNWNQNPYLKGVSIITNSADHPKTRVDSANIEWSRGGRKGDLWVSSTPDTIRGLGWVQTNESSTFVRDGTYKKIPYIDSGVTSDRPTVRLVVGQCFFDTTLGYPVWWNGLNWVNSTGVTV